MRAVNQSIQRRGAGSGTIVTMLVIMLAMAAVGFAVGRMVRGGGESADPANGLQANDAAPAVDASATERPAAKAENADPAPAAKSPPFRFEPEVIDFGFLKPQEIAEGNITIRNVTREPLDILTVKAACACTTVEDVAGRSIAPGATMAVPFTLKGRNAGGERDVKVDFLFDGWGLATVTMKAQYTRAIRCDPGYLLAMQEDRGVVSLVAIDRRPFKVLRANDEAPVFVGFDPASGETRSRYQLRWDVSDWNRETCEDSGGNPFPGHWVIETDHPEAPVVELFLRHPCQMRVDIGERNWRPEVSNTVVGALKPGESFEFETGILALRNNATLNETFHAVLSESDAFTAELVGSRGEGFDTVCTIRVTASPDHSGLMMGMLQLYSSRHSAPIKVIGTVRDW